MRITKIPFSDRTKLAGTETERQSEASDAAAILGLSKWSSPLAVYARQDGNLVPEKEDNEAMRQGPRP